MMKLTHSRGTGPGAKPQGPLRTRGPRQGSEVVKEREKGVAVQTQRTALRS